MFYLRLSDLCHLEVDRLFLRLGCLLSCLGHPLSLGCGIHASPHETGHPGDLCGLDHGEPAWLLCERCGDAVANTRGVEPEEVGVGLLGLGVGIVSGLLGSLLGLLLGAFGGLELLGFLLLLLGLPALGERSSLLGLGGHGMPVVGLEECLGRSGLGKDGLVLVIPDDAALAIRIVGWAGHVDAAHEETALLAIAIELARDARDGGELAMCCAVVAVVLVAAALALKSGSVSPDAGHASALRLWRLARSLRSASSALGFCRLVCDRLHVQLVLLHEFEDVLLLLNGQRGVQGLVETLLRLDHLLGVSLRCEGVENGELSVGEGGHLVRLCCLVAVVARELCSCELYYSFQKFKSIKFI